MLQCIAGKVFFFSTIRFTGSCSALQCVAVCCGVLLRVAVYFIVLRSTPFFKAPSNFTGGKYGTNINESRRTYTQIMAHKYISHEEGHCLQHTETLQHATTQHNTLQHTATHKHLSHKERNGLQHTKTHCNSNNATQHTATHCNTPIPQS